MTADELRAAAIRIFGEKGYTAQLATRLRVNRVQVWRYLSGKVEVPGPVEAAVRGWLREVGA